MKDVIIGFAIFIAIALALPIIIILGVKALGAYIEWVMDVLDYFI